MSGDTAAVMELDEENFSIAESIAEFDMIDFFSEPEPEPAAGPDKAASGLTDVVGASDGSEAVVSIGDALAVAIALDERKPGPAAMPGIAPDEMFSDVAGDAWPVVGEGASGQPPTDAVTLPMVERLLCLRIMDLEHELGDVCREEERLKALVKSAKEQRIKLVEQLQELCDERDNPTTDDDTADDREFGGEGRTPRAATSPTTTAASPAGEAWGREPIEVFAKHGLKPAKVEALRAAADKGKFDGNVVGLRDWIAKYDLWHRDVKGCGPKGADAIIDALTSYVAANPMADQPLTPEDEARHVAAAEFLGHTKPAPAEGQESAAGIETEAEKLGVAVIKPPVFTLSEWMNGVSIKGSEVLALIEPIEPLASNVAPKRAAKRKPKPPTIKTTTTAPATPAVSSFHEANADALVRGQAIMSGKPDPGPSPPIGNRASPLPVSAVLAEAIAMTSPQAEEAYLAGCEAGAANVSCSENPHADRSSPQAREWQRGWDECSAVE